MLTGHYETASWVFVLVYIFDGVFLGYVLFDQRLLFHVWDFGYMGLNCLPLSEVSIDV